MLIKKLFSQAILIPLALLGSYVSANDFASYPEFQAVVSDLVAKGHYNQQELQDIFDGAQSKKKIIEAISRPAEKNLTWAQYQKIFLDGKRPKQGLNFWLEHKQTLAKAEKEYGVPAEIIVAIIGVETRYGKHKGNYRVIDSLSTLAFDYPPRSKFFRSELVEFLILSKEAKINPKEVTGSYAGAMGLPQFISSSYRHYAVDFNQDGTTNLISDPEDAIGSVANYFKQHGWKTGEPITGRATITGKNYDDIINKNLKPELTIRDIQKKGLTSVSCQQNLPAENCIDPDLAASATAMKLEGLKGAEFWLGMQNFYVITRYNHSKLYAMAVFQLSQEIAELKQQHQLRIGEAH